MQEQEFAGTPEDHVLIGDILLAIGDILLDLKERDISLQETLSEITSDLADSQHIAKLQYVDLMTQTHCDLARLAFKVSEVLDDTSANREFLKKSISLRSLQDRIFGPAEETNGATHGEVSLF